MRVGFMLWISKCTELPKLDDTTVVLHRGYKREYDGDPPTEILSPNVKWIKRPHKSGQVGWSMYVKYNTKDGWKESHATPVHLEDHTPFTCVCARGLGSRIPATLFMLPQRCISIEQTHRTGTSTLRQYA